MSLHIEGCFYVKGLVLILNIVGIVLLASVAIANIPQIVQMFKTRDTNGISLTMHAAFVLSWGMWLVYAFPIGDWVLIASNALGFVAELAVTLLVVFYRLTHHENVLGTIKNEGHNLWFIAALVPVMVAGFFSLDLMIVLLAFADMTIILPQVVEVFKVKDLSGSNLLTWWLFVGEACLGIFYAFAIGEPLSYAWAYLYLPCYFIIIWKIVSYKRVLRLAV